ncbi:MAG: hypothetical protein QNK40_10865 [Desulfobacterales bacterium]|nr:hypothetical protein [Desulfobacterales bacterium]MDX2509534.1 hypothetical protein [Desulfobacterales bacterium]
MKIFAFFFLIEILCLDLPTSESYYDEAVSKYSIYFKIKPACACPHTDREVDPATAGL